MQSYHPEIERQMQQFYHSLSEKDRRRYAAIEARKLGHGGIQYVCRLFECNYRTLVHGLRELNDERAFDQATIRKSGGGRPSAFATYENLDTVFLQVLDAHTAGSPMDETIKWTNMTRQAIADAMGAAGIAISVTVVDQLLKKHHFRRRKAVKIRATGTNDQRDAQFENIATICAKATADGNPVLSMDVKKKSSLATSTAKGHC
jgi:hypothetical protein